MLWSSNGNWKYESSVRMAAASFMCTQWCEAWQRKRGGANCQGTGDEGAPGLLMEASLFERLGCTPGRQTGAQPVSVDCRLMSETVQRGGRRSESQRPPPLTPTHPFGQFAASFFFLHCC